MTDLNLLDGGIRMANMSGGGGGFPAAAASPEEEMCNTMELWLNASAANGSAGGDLRRNMVNFSDMRDITYAIPVYGYVTPFLLMITFFTNAVVVAVLSRPHMKSPSNFILCAMAISDLCTLGIPVPMFIYQYTLGKKIELGFTCTRCGPCFGTKFEGGIVRSLLHRLQRFNL